MIQTDRKKRMGRKIAAMARDGIAICAIQIPMTGENVQMSSDVTMNAAEKKVAAAMGVSADSFAAMKRNPIVNKPLHSVPKGRLVDGEIVVDATDDSTRPKFGAPMGVTFPKH